MPAELDLLIRARYPLIWLDTAEEGRAIELVCHSARRLGDPVVGWCTTYGIHDLPGPPVKGNAADPLEALDLIRREERRAIWLLKDLGALADDAREPVLVRALRDTAQVARERGAVLICVGNGYPVPKGLEGVAAGHPLELPTREEHTRLLARVAGEIGVSVAPEALTLLATACLGLTLEQAENIWARVHAAGGRFTPDDIPQVLAEKGRIVRASGFLELMPAADMTDVGGLSELKRWVHNRQVAFSEPARQLGLPFPRGLLLVGVQGCGKSLAAKAIAGRWRQPLLRMDVGALMGGYVGVSENNMRATLRLAERVAPCVLWIDEIEKAFSGLQSDNDGGVITRMFGTLLTWMQEKTSPVFVLATANAIDELPPEMMRKGRFDEIFFVDLPDAPQRAEIWRIHLRDRARSGGDPGLLDRVDLGGLARLSEGYSGAEIAAAVIDGAYAALAEGRSLEARHLTTSLSSSPPLSRTRAESIDALRAWARGRARVAG